MDEYLSEKEQLEQIREWWREYGWYLVGGVVLGALVLIGWMQYQRYEQRRVEAASALYDELAVAVLDRADGQASDLLAQIRADYPGSPYADQGGLLMASLDLDLQRTDAAVEELRQVLDETGDEELALVVRERLARLLIQLQRYDEALAVIDAAEPGRFSARFSELRGDVYLAQGETERARTAYLEAFNGEYTDVLDRNTLQMKIDDLPPQASTAAAVAPEPAAPAPAAAGEDGA